MEERLQKLISAAGLASRRQAETYIQAGRVTVNGVPAVLGQRADPERDEILLDGAPLARPAAHRYIMLHKPRGYVTTLSDERGRRTAAELVADCGVRVYPVGRLDMDSEGLLLFTNDGALTHQLLHPSHQVEKEYQVRVQGNWHAALPVLRGRMELDGVALVPARVKVLRGGTDTALLSIVIHEGKTARFAVCATGPVCASCG
ncbi:MAG: pseudouridine synthase [Oscillospiraceae bacterium]|nr:pseudouridine synthase [Oscillospiraceae bacterium]